MAVHDIRYYTVKNMIENWEKWYTLKSSTSVNRKKDMYGTQSNEEEEEKKRNNSTKRKKNLNRNRLADTPTNSNDF